MKALLLMGSPREGASLRLGRALLASLKEQGLATEEYYLVQGLTQGWGILESAVRQADLLILSSPLYVDSLPAPTIAALEALADKAAGKKMAAILNCGFPEPFHNTTALKICRQFARKAGCNWLGGISLSMGGFSLGKGLSRRVRISMKLAAQALAQGEMIPDRAVHLAARKPIPKWLYLLILNRVFRIVVRKHGKAPIDAMPYIH